MKGFECQAKQTSHPVKNGKTVKQKSLKKYFYSSGV